MRSVGELVFIFLALMARVHAFFAGEIVAPPTTKLQEGQLRQLNNPASSPLRTSFQARAAHLFRKGHKPFGRNAARRSFAIQSQASMALDGGLGPAGRVATTAAWGAARTAAVVLRGGTTEINVISGVLNELANIRTPAALLGGAALGIMYLGPKPGSNPRLHLVYTALSTLAFSLQLVCVLCSTLAYTSAASSGQLMATSAIHYLSENMQFEFFVIRASFIYGLFSFLGALMARGWLTYGEQERGSARVMLVILGGSTLFLLNFLHFTHNVLTLCLGGMTRKLLWYMAIHMYTKRRFIRHVTGIAAIWGAVYLFKLGPNQGDEKIGPKESPSQK